MADNSVVNAFKSHGVVPDVVPQAPNVLAKVTYDNQLEVSSGNELTPTQVQNQPKVEWSAEPNALYTLIMTDPDAPTRTAPTFREMKHWLVVNIPGTDISSGDTLAAYIGSGPPQGTGLHRYIFLVYKQTGKVDTSEITPVANTSRRDRPKFSAAKFAEQNGLGIPVAGNFYQAQYDDFVPILRSRITDN